MFREYSPRIRRAFSLVELVIVVAIIGLLAAMAIPRLSRGAGDSAAAVDQGNLTLLRRAILHYSADHGGRIPGISAAAVRNQLTRYSNTGGTTSATASAAFPYGPYLQSVPALQSGPQAGSSNILIDATNSPPQPNTLMAAGWVYNPNTGEIVANVGASIALAIEP